jgi:hypothetical protein
MISLKLLPDVCVSSFRHFQFCQFPNNSVVVLLLLLVAAVSQTTSAGGGRFLKIE